MWTDQELARWTFYELLWFAAATIIFLPTLPETLPARRLTTKARRIRKQTAGQVMVYSPQEGKKQSLGSILKTTFLRPFLILFDPISFCIAVYTGLVYAILYMMFTIYPVSHRGYRIFSY